MSRHDGKTKASLLASLVILAALAVITYTSLQRPHKESRPPEPQAATLLPELRSLAPFALVDQQGQAFDNRRLLGHWTLLSFGYTQCPDICPTTLAMLARMHQRLQTLGMQEPIEIGFVSIDPARDTPQRLKEYVAYFDPRILGITGSAEALSALTRPLGILYRKVATEDSAMGYVMDHSASLILIDPQGRYHALFSPPHEADVLARDILAISQAAAR